MKQASYDLVVVGTGFASTFFLHQYLKKASPKAKVLVLEKGHLFPHAERVKEKRGEATPYASFNPDSDSTFDNHNKKKGWVFTQGFGGSSNCWYGCTPRFMPSDFKMNTLYGIGKDWPIAYDDLDPYYTQVEELMSISGPAQTPFPKKSPYPLPPHSFSTVDRILHQEYGNLYVPQPTARASVATKGRGACCASTVCHVCPVNAKFTIENSAMGVYEDPRVELLYGAQVYSLDLEQNVARRVNYLKDEREFHVAAEVIALGTNALFNANLLLNSGDTNPFTGQGIGEQIGLLATVYLENLENTGGSTWVNANGYMLYDGQHRRDVAACLMESNNAPYFRLEQGKWRHIAQFRMVFEDLPEAHNYVSTTQDPLRPAIHFKGPSAYAWRGIEHMKAKVPGILSCLPVERIEYAAPFESEAHILGSTRMSRSPAEGVVDQHLRHHQYRNLFVLGSGSFTTYTPANPTLTLSALSLYAADKTF
ncbi:GMC oxidoreductase [Rufibacter glacialis]|uniref:GMC family oxidoreductase n=1 Tax=Rufibacter glacialis TaxID=1259555 RepID=A0A5M8QU95_9BACT|nr:GMC family oxidoreductase [Rufibacter glacialis]KAA6437752.1 GMC family oxidoreductase [Rufibacter glacialis]GGK56581.1 2-keto-gluconate dehydrogenase subunit [Rufibacter glacialis]